jgi:hypothetical protein
VGRLHQAETATRDTGAEHAGSRDSHTDHASAQFARASHAGLDSSGDRQTCVAASCDCAALGKVIAVSTASFIHTCFADPETFAVGATRSRCGFQPLFAAGAA